MDSRKTINTPEVFLHLLSDYHSKGEKVSLLIDQEGISRSEGFITSIHQKGKVEDAVITIDNDISFTLSQLIAVNGNFRSDYSEC